MAAAVVVTHELGRVEQPCENCPPLAIPIPPAVRAVDGASVRRQLRHVALLERPKRGHRWKSRERWRIAPTASASYITACVYMTGYVGLERATSAHEAATGGGFVGHLACALSGSVQGRAWMAAIVQRHALYVWRYARARRTERERLAFENGPCRLTTEWLKFRRNSRSSLAGANSSSVGRSNAMERARSHKSSYTHTTPPKRARTSPARTVAPLH